MVAVVAPHAVDGVIEKLGVDGIPAWSIGEISTSERDFSGFEQGAKGVNGGAVRLTGTYRS